MRVTASPRKLSSPRTVSTTNRMIGAIGLRIAQAETFRRMAPSYSKGKFVGRPCRLRHAGLGRSFRPRRRGGGLLRRHGADAVAVAQEAAGAQHHRFAF